MALVNSEVCCQHGRPHSISTHYPSTQLCYPAPAPSPGKGPNVFTPSQQLRPSFKPPPPPPQPSHQSPPTPPNFGTPHGRGNKKPKGKMLDMLRTTDA